MSGDELRRIIEGRGFTIAEFARAARIPQVCMYDLVHERRKLTAFYQRKIQRALNGPQKGGK